MGPRWTHRPWAALAASLMAAPALAHHPADEHALTELRPRSSVTLGVDAAAFELEGVRGAYQTAALTAEWAFLERFGFGLHLPVHALQPHAASLRTGPGDLSLTARGVVLGSDQWALLAGVGLELPTGDEHQGLGAGHFGAAGFVSGMYRLERVVVHGALGDALSFSGPAGPHGPAHEHVRYVEPHSNHELRYHAGAWIGVREAVWANLVVRGITVLEERQRGQTLFSVAPAVSWSPSPRWHLALGAEVPIFGPHRYEWRATGRVGRSF